MQITRISIITGKANTMDLPVTPEQLEQAKHQLIQHALAHLTPEQREFLLTGVTPQEWEEHLGPPPSEEDDDGEPA
jgi:hypothetical protein